MPRLSSLVLKTLAGLGITLPAGGLSWGSTLNPTYAATYATHDAGSETNYEFGFGGAGIACTDNHTIVGRVTSSSATTNWQRYGAAYIFDNNTGQLLYSHVPTEPEPGTNNTWFGRSVGISDTHYAIEQERGILYLYDLTTGLLLWRRQSLTTWYPSRISFAGSYVILGDNMRGVTVYDVATGDTVTPPSLPSGYTSELGFGDAAYATEDYFVATSYISSPYRRAVHIYRMEPGFPYVGTIENLTSNPSGQFGYSGAEALIAISAASNRIAIANKQELVSGNAVGNLYVYALDTQALLYNIASPNTNNSRWPTNIHASDTYLYAGHNDSKIRVYDITNGQLVNTMIGADRFGLRFAISSHRLATSVRDATAHPKADLYNLYDIL